LKRLRRIWSILSGKPLRKHKSLKKQVDKLKRKLSQPKIEIPKDPVEFFVKVLRIKPYRYQAAFLVDKKPLKVIRWCRRAGKTTLMSGADIHFAAHNPGSTTIITMPKYQQIKEIYFQSEAGLHAHLARMPEEYYEALIFEELQTIIRFRNGAKILPETPEPFTIRGHGPSRINIDEFNFIRQDRDLWLSALLPMTLTRVVHINIASTPWNKDSVYWQMCFDEHFRMFSGNIHEHSPPRYLRTWRDVLKPKGPLDPKQVEIMREQYAGDPWRWKREMECAFVSDETSFLPSSLIIKCQNQDLEFAKFEDAPVGAFFVGWDLGRERDFGVAAVIDKQADVHRLVHCHQFPLREMENCI
jgi:phage FluMu gp28-like protein